MASSSFIVDALFFFFGAFLLLASATHPVLIGPGFWNVRSTFLIDGLDIGTHMSLVQLTSTSKFVLFDTVDLDAELKASIDKLTDNGTLIEAIVATHPFHTTYFPVFYAAYPKVPFYGTPRHLRIEPQIPWVGNMYDCANRQKWLPEIHMRIPQGGEFVNPQPESYNHFSGIHVFHPASRTIHVDDTVVIDEPFKGDMLFHPTIVGPGLYHIPAAPNAFSKWVQKYINEWDFDIICAAHKGIKMGGAKEQLQRVLNDYAVVFEGLIVEYTISPNQTDAAAFQQMQSHEAMCKE